MSNDNFLKRAKLQRDQADVSTICDMLAVVPQKVDAATNLQLDSFSLEVEKEILDILQLDESPAKDLFYARMLQLGFGRDDIKLHSKAERHCIVLTFRY